MARLEREKDILGRKAQCVQVQVTRKACRAGECEHSGGAGSFPT